MYKLLIFDFDGTLADSGGWLTEVVNDVADRYGFKRSTREELEALRVLDNRAILERLGVSWWKLPLIAAHMRKRVSREADRIPLFPGAKPTLETLHERGVRLSVVSSNSEDNVRRILGPELAGLVGHFGCSAGLFGKRAKFKSALRWARVESHEAMSVGDEVRDIEAAQAEGIATGAVTWGYAHPSLLRSRGPTAVFESFDELLDTVLGGRSALVGS